MIYTSYFAKIKSLPEHLVPISICAKAPDGYKGFQYKKLAPKYDMLMQWKENHDAEHYEKCYRKEVLDKLDPLDTVLEISEIAGFHNRFNNLCLICYEKPEDVCHRHWVADWLNERGIACREWS